jgi:regulator of protease activity HflC (stomatin/prohibitin superfamily)
MPQIGFSGLILAVLLIIYFITSAIKILREYERGVIFRLGRLIPIKGPGLIIIWLKVNAVLYFRVIDPTKAITAVEDFHYATSQISQTTLRSVLGQNQLDELLAKRDELNAELQKIIDEQTEPWGIKVAAVEVKNVDLPQEMMRAIAKQAEAERERRAKVIHAEGEFQAAQKLADAAEIIGAEPAALQLRFLQTLTEVATEKNSTILFPIPIDLLEPFIKKLKKEAD